jgi:hypothetical protein
MSRGGSEVIAIDEDLSGINGDEPTDGVQEGGLATA